MADKRKRYESATATKPQADTSSDEDEGAQQHTAQEELTLSPTKRPKQSLNGDLVHLLIELADHEKNVLRNLFKSNVYRKAARAIGDHPTKITCGEDAKKLPGVGEKIAKKIDEFVSTGALKKLEKIRQDPNSKAIQLLASVHGIGPAAAAAFVMRGITTLEQLKHEKLNQAQQIGLRHYDDFNLRIPRKEMDRLREIVLGYLRQVDMKVTGEICGSYRRGAESSGDIDLIVTHPEFLSTQDPKPHQMLTLVKRISDSMVAQGFVTDVLSCGDSKFMGVCRIPDSDQFKTEDGTHHFRRIDIRIIPTDQYHCGTLYFTGSDELNKEMRRKAIELGFHLSEYCIKPVGENGFQGDPLPVSSERDVFDYLDMKYLEPHER
eukprot:m.119699 g.119699  ORF g.119699 m.119699 type:complete len:378 (-) comp52064_c0_seq1:137-1270(-)